MSSSSLWAMSTPNAVISSTTTAPAPVFTTEYYFTAQAADISSAWLATYTIQEICTGEQESWTQPSIPPDFTSSVVTCNACATPTMTITCPINSEAQTGWVSIWGDGVTATPAPAATIYASPLKGDGDVWWAGPLLTASGSQTGFYDLSQLKPAATYAVTSDAVTIWGSMALLSGVVTFAIGWLLFEL
ncbi:hypothetical protein N0V93_006638 [Gnomoniopsis smithogilvyi]|uniref:Uncharacterized protein n=1 Tax=Gnomoniopsis smithogilvyi TaxID=1191159 RepID=A0A9W8YSA0_9PEZI|nr:hypothetical protein N0V93_006638 [Gnomoniopsis smithogilvyi]